MCEAVKQQKLQTYELAYRENNVADSGYMRLKD